MLLQFPDVARHKNRNYKEKSLINRITLFAGLNILESNLCLYFSFTEERSKILFRNFQKPSPNCKAHP